MVFFHGYDMVQICKSSWVLQLKFNTTNWLCIQLTFNTQQIVAAIYGHRRTLCKSLVGLFL